MCPIPPIKLRSTASVSNEAVEQATGRGWAAWFELLDARGGEHLDHQRLVALLVEEGVRSGWWQQTVAAAYRGRKG